MFILTAIFHQSVHSTETRLPDGRAHTLSAVSRAVLVVLYHPWQPGQCTSSLLLLLFCYMTNEFFFFSYLKTSVSPCHVTAVVKVDRRIRWHYTTTILRLRIGARLTRYRNCKSHNFARTISRHADGISRYSVPPSAGPLLPLCLASGGR